MNQKAGHCTVSVGDLLQFFDENPEGAQQDSNSIIAVAGEEFGAGIFKHFVSKNRGGTCQIHPESVTTANKKGPRLDKWIGVHWKRSKSQLFQTEIKNWNAHSLGGKPLPVSAKPEIIREYLTKRFSHEFDLGEHKLKKKQCSKVLVRMKVPPRLEATYQEVAPLLIYWCPLNPRGDVTECFFSESVSKGAFRKLWFFSMSSYLRGLKVRDIKLVLPVTVRRMNWLNRLFRHHPTS